VRWYQATRATPLRCCCPSAGARGSSTKTLESGAGAPALGEPELLTGWAKAQDASGAIYYFNADTGSARWEAPLARPSVPPPSVPPPSEPPPPSALLQQESSLPPPAVPPPAMLQSAAPSKAALGGGWKEVRTSDGNIYYHDEATGESRWEKPDAVNGNI